MKFDRQAGRLIPDDSLTEQQDRALRLILDGARQAKIALVLGVSKSRTREIVRRLCEKFEVEAMHDLPDAYQAALERNERIDCCDSAVATGGAYHAPDCDDDGRIRVDGADAKV